MLAPHTASKKKQMAVSNVIFNNPKILSKISGVIQVGASIGEEVPEWERYEIKNQVFIEPIPHLFPDLEARAKKQHHNPNVRCYKVALSDYDGEGDFHISSRSFCSSSLLPFHKDAVYYGQTFREYTTLKVPVKKLDTLVAEENLAVPSAYDLLYVDVQGAEHKLMLGAERTLPFFQFVFVEVNLKVLYDGVTLWDEFDRFMKQKGFRLVDFRNLEGSAGAQGEAFYQQTKQRN